MNDEFSLTDLTNLVHEGQGLALAIQGKPEAGTVPQPARAQDPGGSAPAGRDKMPGGGPSGGKGGTRKILIALLAALVLGYLGWKGTGKPLVGLAGAVVAFLAAWFLL